VPALAAATALVGCGQSPEKPDAGMPATTAAADTAAPAAAQEAGGPCSLVADASATFGQAVTAEKKTMPNNTTVCEWKSADGRICGSVTPLGAKWNPVPDVPRNYGALVASLGAFGEVRDQPGIGKEARIVNGGMLGVQLAFRTDDAAVLVASACSAGNLDATAMAQKLATEIASKL
jgi:hypothetical protein